LELFNHNEAFSSNASLENIRQNEIRTSKYVE